MPKAPIYRGHRLPGQSTTRGITAPVTVQRVVQVGNTPPQQIPTTENDPVIRGSWRFVPAGTDDTTMAMLGNLDGYYGYAAATFGMAIGEYATGKPNITIEDVNGLRIRNYETAVLTLDLLGNAAFEGEITAASGEIGGWTIGAADLTGGDATLAAAGTLTLGTGDDVIVLDASAALYRLWAGDAVAADAPFSVTKAGVLAATSGTIGGWTLSAASLTGGDAVLAAAGSLTLGTGDDVAVLSAADALYRLWAGDATPADAPFSVTKLGDLVARNADIRGTIRTSVFELGQVQATAGTQLVTKSAGKIATDYVVQDNLLVIETPEAGGWLFETDDWIRITAMPIGGAVVGTTWVQVTRTATLNEYATSGSLDGATYPAGTVAEIGRAHV